MCNLRRHRYRHLALLISALALFAQTLLPVTHAMAMAQRSGTATSRFFCGPVSAEVAPQLQAAIRAALTPASDHGKTQLLQKPSCSICASGHAAQMALPPTVAGFTFSLSTFADSATDDLLSFIASRVRTPPSRGPPRFS